MFKCDTEWCVKVVESAIQGALVTIGPVAMPLVQLGYSTQHHHRCWSAQKCLLEARTTDCPALWFAATGYMLQTCIWDRGQPCPDNMRSTSCLLSTGSCVCGRCNVSMLFVCLQPHLCLVNGACSVKFHCIPGWKQHLKSLLSLSKKMESSAVNSWPLRNAIQVAHKLFNQCKVSIVTNPADQVWLFLGRFQHFFFPWPLNADVVSQPVRGWKLSKL